MKNYRIEYSETDTWVEIYEGNNALFRGDECDESNAILDMIKDSTDANLVFQEINFKD